jgi:hypothetical protein
MVKNLKSLLAHSSETAAVVFVDDNGRVCIQEEDGTTRALSVSETYVEFPQLRIGGGATAPILIEAGPTLGYLFTIDDVCYGEVPIHPAINREAPVILGCSWAPSGAESSKTVSWKFEVLACKVGAAITTIDATLTAADQPIPTSTGIYSHSVVVVPASLLEDPDVDEFHFKITRIASSADPTSEPGIHHLVCVQSLK